MLKKYLLFVVSIVVISFFVIGCSSSTSAERGGTKSFGEVEDNLDPTSVTQSAEEEITSGQITTTEKKEVFYAVQLGAFERISNVERFEKLIKSKFPLDVKTEYDESSGYYKVSVGKYASKEEAYNLRDFCVQNGYKDAWVIEYK